MKHTDDWIEEAFPDIKAGADAFLAIQAAKEAVVDSRVGIDWQKWMRECPAPRPPKND
jgi:hypothetical protein